MIDGELEHLCNVVKAVIKVGERASGVVAHIDRHISSADFPMRTSHGRSINLTCQRLRAASTKLFLGRDILLDSAAATDV